MCYNDFSKDSMFNKLSTILGDNELNTLTSFELALSRTEKELNNYRVIPILGMIPAIFKIVLGIIQTIVALVIAAIAILFSWTSSGQDVISHSFRHVIHGMGNILYGALLLTPVVGFLLSVATAISAGVGLKAYSFISVDSGKQLGYQTLYHYSKDGSDTVYKKNDDTVIPGSPKFYI